ncbi:inositol 2-dehydrogenase, partial [Verminephrobacter eiseniae]|nr:inositol 2-dehydrogenase [Verminephrobacter eiseniae]
MSAARPPEGAHTAAEGEGIPSIAARPPEGTPMSTPHAPPLPPGA